MRELQWDDFAGAEGTDYQAHVGDDHVDLILENAVELPSSGRPGGSFRLDFRGPVQPGLEQGTYRFSKGAESLEIFIVPIGRDEKGMLYEAIFY